jgi:hypothetical protein
MSARYRLHFNLFRASPTGISVPEVIHSYLVLASPWTLPDSGVASMVPLSAGAPSPDMIAIVVGKGGARAALTTAINEILSLPGNAGLQTVPQDLSVAEEW